MSDDIETSTDVSSVAELQHRPHEPHEHKGHQFWIPRFARAFLGVITIIISIWLSTRNVDKQLTQVSDISKAQRAQASELLDRQLKASSELLDR